MSDCLILLDIADNVLVARRAVRAGEQAMVEGTPVTISQDTPLGHKIARHSLALGDKVIKYGMSIGSVTATIGPGDWVHLHNMKSDYMSTHTRSDQSTHA